MATGGASTTVTRRLGQLRDLGLIESRAPAPRATRWCGAQSRRRRRRPRRPPSDPEYVRYLNSKAWATKRAEVLDRADGMCEECGDELEPGEAEVHHLTYERRYAELAEDLVALCPGCHRRAHGR